MEKALIKRLKSLFSPEAVAGMARFGINPKNMYGVSIPVLRRMAKEIGKNHLLAQRLWRSGIHEARILAGMIDRPEEVTENQSRVYSAKLPHSPAKAGSPAMTG
jgi:3-methyladenine DNA glycosylase AlkD